MIQYIISKQHVNTAGKYVIVYLNIENRWERLIDNANCFNNINGCIHAINDLPKNTRYKIEIIYLN